MSARHTRVASSGSTSDEEYDESNEYVIPVLNPPPSNGFEDDESNQYFMSEPSVSEDGGEESVARVRAPHRLVFPSNSGHQISSLGNGNDRFAYSSEEDVISDSDMHGVSSVLYDGRRVNMPSSNHRDRRRSIERQSQTISPGNTSLSSFEHSPAMQRKVLLQFVMPESRRARQQREMNQAEQNTRQDDNRQDGPALDGSGNEIMHNVPYSSVGDVGPFPLPILDDSEKSRRRMWDASKSEAGSLPPLRQKVSKKTKAARETFYSSNSNSNSSVDSKAHSKDRRSTYKSIINLRDVSQGVLTDRGEWQDEGMNEEEIKPGIRNDETGYATRQPHSRLRDSIHDNNSTPSSMGNSRKHTDALSTAMTLSDSEAGDNIDESVNLTVKTSFDGDVQHSADDEQTVGKPARAGRGTAKPAHKRTRSGDGAAAFMATGEKNWRGMQQNQVPLPTTEADDDDDFPIRPSRSRPRQPRPPPQGDRIARRSPHDYDSGLNGQSTFEPTSLQNDPLDSSVIPKASRQQRINQISPFRQSQIYEQSVVSLSRPQKPGEMHHDRSSIVTGSFFNQKESPRRRSSCHVGHLKAQNQVLSQESVYENYESLDAIANLEPKPQTPQSPSPFANLGRKSAEKAPRSTFLPTWYANDTNYPTFLCPRCNTRQREFFTVENAAGSMEGPGSYLALYFSIYVICSLFIFGLEEGWMPMDCIYFAVITLTTAGLGDFVPTSNANKIICSIFIYFGVACIGLLLGSYIAGMLDDRASRDRKAKQMNACPNCARIQTLKDAAAKRDKEALYSALKKSPRFASERPASLNFPVLGPPAVYKPSHQIFSPVHSGEGFHRAGSELSSDIYSGAVKGPKRPTASHFLGSPTTRQILGRQRHTRHSSMDIGSSFFQADAGKPKSYGTAPVRKFSEEGPTPESKSGGIHRGSSVDKPRSLRPIASSDSLADGFSVEESDDDSVDDEGSTTSEYTCTSASSTDEIWDGVKSKIQAAKYVFLTLRRALLNSMLIIFVGCIGFWLIEGFTLVDSWYFTTVLLTTVGYGDLTPSTAGGKLFSTIYILVAGTVLLNNMSSISMIPLELRRRRIERAILTQFGDHLDDAALRELATGPVIQRLRLSANRTDGLDECTREMFSLAMLVRLGKVTEQDIRGTFASFRHLDVNNEGVLNSRSIIAGMIAKQRLSAANPSFPIPPPPPPPPQAPLPVHGLDTRPSWTGGLDGGAKPSHDPGYCFENPLPSHVPTGPLVVGTFNERSSLLDHRVGAQDYSLTHYGIDDDEQRWSS